MTPPAKAKALAEAIPGAATELLPGAGHMMMSEAPGCGDRRAAADSSDLCSPPAL